MKYNNYIIEKEICSICSDKYDPEIRNISGHIFLIGNKCSKCDLKSIDEIDYQTEMQI